MAFRPREEASEDVNVDAGYTVTALKDYIMYLLSMPSNASHQFPDIPLPAFTEQELNWLTDTIVAKSGRTVEIRKIHDGFLGRNLRKLLGWDEPRLTLRVL